MIYERLKSRLLPERSFLYYSYPQPGKQRDIGFYFPMFQNIAVAESQKPRFSQLEILGRSGNLFTYQGANSRTFRLQFSFNLDHINHYVSELEIPKLEFSESKNKDRWLRGTSDPITSTKFDYYNSVVGRLNLGSSDNVQFTREFGAPLGDGETLERTLANEYLRGDPRNTKDVSVNVLILLLNVIRTSTIGNSSNTSLGPPTIYLNHGTMYNNIPCVCTNYSISFDETSTYEIFSLTPKTIKVMLDLSENRTGDFGKFQKFSHVKGENLAGWECVIDQGTLDPNNSRFNRVGAVQNEFIKTGLQSLVS